MNKFLIFTVALCNMIFLGAMEKERTLLPITQQESDFFKICVNTSVQWSNKAVADNKISSGNAIYIMNHRCSKFLRLAGNDLSQMIKNQNLEDRLEKFKRFESDRTVMLLKNNLFNIHQDGQLVEASKKSLFERRKELAEFDLQAKQPTYYKPLKNDNRVGYTLRNEHFSTDEVAEKDYIATFIYQHALAPRIVIYDEF